MKRLCIIMLLEIRNSSKLPAAQSISSFNIQRILEKNILFNKQIIPYDHQQMYIILLIEHNSSSSIIQTFIPFSIVAWFDLEHIHNIKQVLFTTLQGNTLYYLNWHYTRYTHSSVDYTHTFSTWVVQSRFSSHCTSRKYEAWQHCKHAHM